MPPFDPLIVTLEADQRTFEHFDALRRQHFPARRNVVPAHVTLFHALPGEHSESIDETLRATCAAQPPFELRFPALRSLGRGVAAEAASSALLRVRGELAHAWQGWLNAQDQQRFKPHITIQNKVSAEEARATLHHLSASWEEWRGTGEALTLWRYIGGPWEHVATFPFGESDDDKVTR